MSPSTTSQLDRLFKESLKRLPDPYRSLHSTTIKFPLHIVLLGT